MRKLVPAALAALLVAGTAAALEAPRKLVDYDIKVSLDPETKLVEGTETLRWTNPSPDQVDALKFHLYWNAFRNNHSTFFKESGGQLRGDKADTEKGWGYVDVTSMAWDGKDLRGGFRFEAPDDGNTEDRTVLSVALPRPVGPGETITLQIAWKAKVPRVFARAGFVRDFFMFGQWFPKIGVYEPAGARRREKGGWNCHQYHANSEFYADWGDYKVAMTLPEKFVVGSAGALVSETKAGGKKTLTYVQKDIHDFAWTCDPRYVMKDDVFDPEKDVPAEEWTRASKLLGRSPEELRKGFHKVALRFAMQPDHEAQWVRYRDAKKWALAWFGLYAFPYPYAQVTCVDPPEDGGGAAGMEYQTLYTAGTWKRLGSWPFDKVRFQEMVVIHEFGHGYWMGLLASNEFEESWMDEGINSFTEYEMCDRRYRYFLEIPGGFGLADTHLGRSVMVDSRELDGMATPAWKFASNGSYGRNSYPRPATVINQIRAMVGEERFWKAFRGYAERWRFDHPTSEDFFDAIQPATGPGTGLATAADYRALIDQTFYANGTVDYWVINATSVKRDEVTGFDDARKPLNFVEDPKKDKEKKKALDKAKAEAEKKDKDKGPFDSRVLIGRAGTISLPVDVVLTFENGRTWKTTWSGRERWIRYSTVYSSRLVKVVVDPDQKIVLDRSPLDNAWYSEKWKGASATRKSATYALHFFEIALSSLATLL
jgi:hypothetical protein